MEDEADTHGTLYGHSIKGEVLYRLEAQIHLHIHDIQVPVVRKTMFSIHAYHVYLRYHSCRLSNSVLTFTLLFDLTGRVKV